jgi:hypothetical protein
MEDAPDIILLSIVTVAVLLTVAWIGYEYITTDAPDDNYIPTDIQTILEHQYGVEIYEVKDTGRHRYANDSITFWGTAVTSAGEYMYTYNTLTSESTWVSA